MCQPPGDVTPGDDEIALGQVLDIHHPPHQRQSVGGQREQGADHHPVDDDLYVDNRELEQQGKVSQYLFHGIIGCWSLRPDQ